MIRLDHFSDPAALRQALLTDRSRVLTQLYQRAFPVVRRHVQRHGGTEADAQDVFQDALVVFYEQAVGEMLTLTAAASTYLVGVSRNLWRRELVRRSRLPAEPTDAHPELPAEPEPEPAPALAVRDYVEQLGARCRDILLAFYYFQQPLSQIAATHQFRTVRSATVQKFKCLERLRTAVRNLREQLLPA
ncbi:RNA polymerase sigma factor [Hymenobacter weizhouensis]|uniref:RNA polymerase sigma factor n=1 Tax=Hymenobacter sp. YIM 151500-1 TaxID=2987689 RepID=UPI00222729C6|nr:sigma-70 family RNA polymerase sigma factor [Hymenobacter sp. YIM 151500-1]UYZ63753.1 sigma-70 family RNA polymerase sigma factor [Hymenobacter sp. YIM 151500-1]